MSRHPVRTITIGIAEVHPIPATVIERAKTILERARARYHEEGYEVQTVRLSTRPIFDDLADWSPGDILRYGKQLQGILDDLDLSYCSLGPAQVARPAFPLERLDLIADLLAMTSALNCTVQMAQPEYGLRSEAALPIARIMKRLAQETKEGFGNFNFAMLACVDPGSPFFPAAYHAGPANLTLGLQGAGIVTEAIRAIAAETAGSLDLVRVTQAVRETLVEHARPVITSGNEIAQENGLQFGGIDLSPAPLGEDSIAEALELCGYGPVGSSGTLAVVGALTAALKSTDLPTCGYCGLMLPVLEDVVLGKRWEQNVLHVHQLLLYSAVCGTGLDALPLPGDESAESIAHLLLDVATLALRLRKPLSARLFPVPGKQSGEYTTFTSPYLTNTLIR